MPNGTFSCGCDAATAEMRRKAEDVVAEFGFGKRSRKEILKPILYAHLWRSLANLNVADRKTRILLTWLFGGNE